MESKHKNALIVVLVAVILVMAVGYAAFTQQLTINTTANITDQTTNWNIHYDTTKTTGTGVVDPTMGSGGTTAPDGSVSYDGTGQTATIKATLNQPGDTVKFTLTIKNDGTIKASLGTPTVAAVAGDSNNDPLIVQEGNIIFSVTAPAQSTLSAGEETTMTVTATFDNSAESVGNTTSSSITVTTTATQVA